jgi:hypothetical protein
MQPVPLVLHGAAFAGWGMLTKYPNDLNASSLGGVYRCIALKAILKSTFSQ